MTFFLAISSAHAQNPGGGPPTGAGENIQSLSSKLTALTARVAILEGQITAADLLGTYAVHGFQVELGGAVPGIRPAAVSSYVFRGTATLLSGGLVNFSSASEDGNTLTFGAPPTVSPFQGSGNAGGTSTWSYTNGLVTILGGAPPLSLTAGGRVLVGASANHTDGTDVILILTRLQ